MARLDDKIRQSDSCRVPAGLHAAGPGRMCRATVHFRWIRRLNSPSTGGRPLTARRKRQHQIALRLNDQELRHLNRQSNLSGLSREALYPWPDHGQLSSTRAPAPTTPTLLRKVAGLCNNANQLAHRANCHRRGRAGERGQDDGAGGGGLPHRQGKLVRSHGLHLPHPRAPPGQGHLLCSGQGQDHKSEVRWKKRWTTPSTVTRPSPSALRRG